MKAIGRIPSDRLYSLCTTLEDKIDTVEFCEGYDTPNGWAYRIQLAAGWRVSGTAGLHLIIVGTATEAIDALNNIRPCLCRDCRLALNEHLG